MFFKDCLKNRIVPKREAFKCFLCHSEIANELKDVQEHFNNWRHKKLLNQMDKIERNKQLDVISFLSEPECKTLVENEIALARKNYNYRCYLCSVYISSMLDVQEHIDSFVHKKNYKKIIKKEAVTKDDKLNWKIEETVKKGQEYMQCYFEKVHTCRSCQVTLENYGLVKYHCMLHLFQVYKLKQNDVIYFDYKENNVTTINCLVCQVTIHSFELLEKHLNTQEHLSLIKYLSSITKNDYSMLKLPDIEIFENPDQYEIYGNIVIIYDTNCLVCDKSISGLDITQHAETKQHYENLLRYSKHFDTKKKKKNKTDNPKSTLVHNTNKYMCFLCSKSCPDVSKLLLHYSNDTHRYKIAYMNTILKLNKNKTNYSLEDQEKTNTSFKINENISLNSKSFEKEFQASQESLDSFTSYESSLNEMDKIKDEVEESRGELDLYKLQRRKLTLFIRKRKPRTPKTMSIENTAHSKSLLNFGKSFIRYCIKPGEENIYNLEPEKLDLMKLGIFLTFPCKLSQRICLPCAEKFPGGKHLLFEHLQSEEHIQNLREMEMNDKEFQDYPDQLSDLKLAKNYMQDQSDDWVKCYTCNVNIENEDEHLFAHIEKAEHVTECKSWKKLTEDMYEEFLSFFNDVWYYAQIFSCEVCGVRIETEINFVKHLESPVHLEKVNNLKSKETIFKFHTCPVCITFWYGNSNSYSIHCQDKFHKRFAKNGEFMVPSMPLTVDNLLNNVDKTISDLIDESDKVTSEEFKDLELLKTVEETVKSIYSHAKAYAFGSRLALLGSSHDSVEIILDCEDSYHERITEKQSEQYLSSVKKCFESKPYIWIMDEIVLVNNVPIMKLQHVPFGLQCNISFTNGHDVKISKLIRAYNLASPICRKLILYLKKWLTQCRLFGSDYITTFAISWCVIFYLQIKRLLPTVCELVKLKIKLNLEDDWEYHVIERIPIADSDLSFEDHLQEFFRYYANFDYKTNIVCPYLGKLIKKNSFAFEDQLLYEAEIYKFYININDIEPFPFDSPMCVQDPLDHSQNLTKGIKKRYLRYFRHYCDESAVLCSYRK